MTPVALKSSRDTNPITSMRAFVIVAESGNLSLQLFFVQRSKIAASGLSTNIFCSACS